MCNDMVFAILAIISSRNGLVPGSTKPLPEAMLTHCQLDS